jgi:predicted amidohydrolase YtcJ
MRRVNLVISFLIILLLSSCKSKINCDMLVTNARIYAVDSLFSTVEAMAVHDGKILETGTTDYILGKYHSDEIQDLSGLFVYPGFIDAHCHFLWYGMDAGNADLSNTDSFEEMIDILKTHAAENPEGWIVGRGWDQNKWENKIFPDKSRLDEIFPDRPVFLIRVDAHAALVNSAALKLARVDEKSRVEGGDFLKDSKGRLTGILVDNAINQVENIIPKPQTIEIEKGLLSAQSDCFEVGLTSVHDAGLDKNSIDIIMNMQDQGRLKMRIYAMINPDENNLKYFSERGIIKTDYLNIRSIKLFADGALGSRGALLTEPYSDDKNNRGLLLTSEETLLDVCLLADSIGFQVCTHCIGDEANRIMLNMYGDILKGQNDKRWRIEHAQALHPEDFQLYSKYSVIPSIQTTHATSDMTWAGERLGSERLKSAYAYKQLLDENGWLPNGSDFPVEKINPLFGFYAAVARKDHKGWPHDGFQMENALSRQEALKAMTIWAAKSAFEENEKGSLEKGKFADFVVLDRDIMHAEENEILLSNVLMTVSGGEIVFIK